MNKLTFLLLPLFAFANQITMDHAVKKPLGKIVKTNAQITQLSDQKQKIVSRLPGHIEKYFVSTGQKVKNGDKVALIESIELSKMSAEYVALKQQSKAAREQLATAKKLYKKGLTSQNELNQNIIDIESVLAKQNSLASQMKSLGIKASELKKATDQFILYAHADGIVGQIFVPLHSNVNAEDPLMSIVNQSAYYAIAYLGMEDAMKVDEKTTGFVSVAGKQYPANFVQLQPTIDEETQRAKVLFMLMENPKNILINAFTEMDISLAPFSEAVMVKKSSLSLFKGEWVVFTETKHEGEEHEGEKAHSEDNHKEKAEDHEHEEDHDAKHEESEDHEHGGDEDHEEVPYTAKVVKIIAYNGDEVAVEGIKEGEEYVSDGVYFVKSMILKSSLGEHGH
ncbi:Probable Co/Zn/Cd efflux system membrane fusion protein [hydrothermal vent metagenome]|uniref:Probable Co/Zn/Cd efflux system membrane fusion protein n=1 Tax=hydrothermal vent metagenome TaxID=652676 RepID=A0A1W1EFP5_9ZZZZ